MAARTARCEPGGGDGAAVVYRILLQRDEVGEKNDQRGLAEFRRLQRAEAFEAKPAMGFGVEEENHDLQEQHDAQ